MHLLYSFLRGRNLRVDDKSLAQTPHVLRNSEVEQKLSLEKGEHERNEPNNNKNKGCDKMKIEDWGGENNKVSHPLDFIKENPDEIYELLIHYDEKCRYWFYKYKTTKNERNLFFVVIIIITIISIARIMRIINW